MIRKPLIAAAALCALSATVFAPTAEARMRFNGLSANGVTLNGFTLNGISFNAASAQGATSIDATGLLAITLPGGVTLSAE